MSSEERKARKSEYIKTAVIITAVALVISVIWLLASPFIKKSRLKKLNAMETAAEVSASSAAENTKGSGEAGHQVIGDDRDISFDVPGWQHSEAGWWYAVDDDSYYQNGWAEIDKKRYHFNRDGYMDTGWTAIDGKGYYFGENGVYDTKADPSKVIALTFDDGPGEYTMDLLNLLEKN